MLRKLFIIAIPLLLFGCDVNTGNKGADGYKFGTPTYEKEVVEIKIITYNSRASFEQEAKRRKIKGEKDLMAFAVLRPPFDKCEVHIIDPKVNYIPEFAGHEMYHCFYGQWHE